MPKEASWGAQEWVTLAAVWAEQAVVAALACPAHPSAAQLATAIAAVSTRRIDFPSDTSCQPQSAAAAASAGANPPSGPIAAVSSATCETLASGIPQGSANSRTVPIGAAAKNAAASAGSAI